MTHMTIMNNRDNNKVDERIAQLLRELEPDSAMDDLQLERLARRIAASASQEMERRPVPWELHTARWPGGLISAGLAAAVALLLVALHAGGTDQTAVSWRPLITNAQQEATRDDRGDLFAASFGAVSEHDFIANLWDQVDTEALLTRSERQ
jgi:hypothetical protein